MANFFGKPKTNSARTSPAQESEAAVAPGSSSSQSAFEKTFKPFVVKKDAEVARPNWFLDPKTNELHRKREGARDIIIIDDDDVPVKTETADVKMENFHEVASQMSTKGSLLRKRLSLFWLTVHSSRMPRIHSLHSSALCRFLFQHCSSPKVVSTLPYNTYNSFPTQ
jgi:hypothetical protein